ncbi:MAG: FAD-binding protein [Halomonadaceae bacterium]|nr:MAG: FAD-binding protein [Halomonadaceae bacterium]
MTAPESAAPPIVIIGGGLSGLALACRLQQQGRHWCLLEARERLGGRLFSNQGADYGAAWFWPRQPLMARWVAHFGLTVFPQWDQGQVLLQRGGSLKRLQAPPAPPSYRLTGGMQSLVMAMATELDSDRVFLDRAVTGLTQTPEGVAIAYGSDGGAAPSLASQVVIAIPPRLVQQHLQIQPPLPESLVQLHLQTPTWMAGHAKATVTYDQPFWRQQGLAMAFSETGPLREIQDASPQDASRPALFGFFGWDARQRQQLSSRELEAAVVSQLLSLFGEQAAEPLSLHIHDWAGDPWTATAADQEMLNYHPHYQLGPRPQWDQRLVFAGSESALEYGGFAEGALAAADAALAYL